MRLKKVSGRPRLLVRNRRFCLVNSEMDVHKLFFGKEKPSHIEYY